MTGQLETNKLRETVSVVIPCYNAGGYLRETVASALRQVGDGVELEVLVINDQSDDPETLNIFSNIVSDKRVRVLQNIGRRGPAAARNTGIASAKGAWIAFMDADDMFALDSIAARLAVLGMYPDAVWIGGDVARCDEGGVVFEQSYFRARSRSMRYLQRSFDTGSALQFDDALAVFLDVALVNTTSSIIRTSAIREVGGFDERLRLQQDLHFFLRLAQRNPFVFVPVTVAINRKHANNSTSSYTRTLRYRHAALSLLAADTEFNSSAVFNRKLRHVARELSYEHLKARRYIDALKWRMIAKLGLRTKADDV